MSSKFAFKCSVIQQQYGSNINSRSTCSLDFKLTMKPGTTNQEHRKLIGVRAMSLFGHGIQFLLSGVLPLFQNLNYILQKRLSEVLSNQQSHQVSYSNASAPTAVPYPAFTTVLCTYHAGVRRGAVARLSRHDSAHRLVVKRLGCGDIHYVSPFQSKFGLTSYWKYPPPRSLVYILLYTTRRGAISVVTLKGDLYVFLASSIGCRMYY